LEAVALGAHTAPRTLTLGRAAGSPTVSTKVFGRATKAFGGAAFVRTLNEVGQPLPEVEVVESGPEGVRVYTSDTEAGLVTLGQRSGSHTWRFSKPGYVSVWRNATLVSNQVTVLPHPRLTPIGSNSMSGLSPQSLPGLLPLGWSPVQAFWTESAGDTQAPPNGFIPRGRSVVLARFSQTELQWETIQILTGDGTNALPASIAGPGAYVLAIPDSGAP